MARFILLLLFVAMSTVAFSQTALSGKVTDEESGEGLINATLKLYKNGVFVTGKVTDFDGNFSFSPLTAGTYELEVSNIGYKTVKTPGIIVYVNKTNTVNVKLPTSATTLVEVVVRDYEVPLIEQDNTTQGQVVTAKEISKLATKSINGIAATTAGASSVDEGDAVSIRGSRSNATDYYVDGIRVRGSMIPESEIEQIQVITGGLPASIGDVTGGVISITTKGPSNKFSGVVELETSEYLDDYQYRLLNFSLSGPILKNDKGLSIIGYRLSGRYRYNGDRDPSGVGVYALKPEVYDRLLEDPLQLISSGGELVPVPAAQFLQDDDVELLRARPNSDATRYDVIGKLDFRLGDNINLAIGGNYNYRDQMNTTNSVLNYRSNRPIIDRDMRGFVRLRHNLSGTGEEANKGTIRNASYTLQFSYDFSDRTQSNPIHGDNILNYGYIGVFDHTEVPVFAPEFVDGVPTGGLVHAGNNITLVDYIPSDINQNLTNYNKFVEDFDSRTDFPYFNGNRPEALMSIYGLHANVGDIYNQNRKSENHQYQFNVSGNFDIVPKGAEKTGKHSIQFGIMYEQRVDRAYVIAPRRLWEIGRQLVNAHFNDLDTNNVIGQQTLPNGQIVDLYANLAQDDVWAAEDPQNRTSGQNFFDRSLRNALGVGRTTWIDIDELTPDMLDLSYFSATELGNANLIRYNGYDYLGNELGGDVSFNDFFTAKDANGEPLRPIAPNQPIYTAAYIQDKFHYKDRIFRVRLRVDRYDPNTKTLKDNYTLYDAYTASEWDNLKGTTRPSTIGDDFVVYIDETSEAIEAYRNGDNWFDANGTPVNNAINIFGVDQAYPALVNTDDNIQSDNFDPNSTFVDAEPTVTWMPRLAFSFPISEEANFYAHYDVLTQRPPSNSLATPFDYFYFIDNIQRNDVFNNPSLRPERTVDYEVGFKQKISNTSAINFSAYYKELRDMIQAQTFIYAYPGNYDSFGNQDFGTVKGFNFGYDLRRTGNVSLKATYTLQFADGTGSDANSQRGIANRGNLRVIYPFTFDERHRLTATMDFRYDNGKYYNGPTINGRKILENFGVNLTFIAASGRPYTEALIADVLQGVGTRGGINQARKPWNTVLNLRIDKDVQLAKGLDLNIYLRVQNLLDARNVLNVYRFTGSADDDGFLASSDGFAFLQQQLDQAAVVRSYQWRVLNPGFYSLPRRIFLGALVSF